MEQSFEGGERFLVASSLPACACGELCRLINEIDQRWAQTSLPPSMRAVCSATQTFATEKECGRRVGSRCVGPRAEV